MGRADEAFGGGRVSAQRSAIADAVLRMPGAFTVDGLVHAVRQREPGIGVATVYRAVAAMEASGFLEAVGSRDAKALYAHCPHAHHHHHLICTCCGTTVECACPVDDAFRDTADASGFTLTTHEVTLYGLCRACRAEES